MPKYTLIDPATGRQWTLSELKLTRNLQIGYLLLRGNEHLGIITHRDLVIFIRWCAGEMLKLLVDEPDLKVTHALSLVDRWLEDERSLSNEELKDAAEAAAQAAWAAARASWAAHIAAQTAAWAAHAAAQTASWAATMAADRAAEAAVWAARAAGAAAGATSYEVQAQWFEQHLQSGK